MSSGRHVPSRAAAIAVLLAVAACRRGGGAQGAAEEAQPVTLSAENVAIVAERTVRSGPGIQGTLRARREAVLRAEVEGKSQFKDRFMAALEGNEEVHYETVRAHIERHVRPFGK